MKRICMHFLVVNTVLNIARSTHRWSTPVFWFWRAKRAPLLQKLQSAPIFSPIYNAFPTWKVPLLRAWERVRRGQVLKGIITACAITHHSTFLGKCDPSFQARCHHSPLPTLPSPLWFEGKRNIWHLHAKKHERGSKWRVVGEKTSWRALSPTESKEHREQINFSIAVHGLWSACSWWLDAVPPGPAPNICLGELQVLGSGMWLSERKPWFIPCLLLAYSCLTEGGSVISKPSWSSRFLTKWSDSIGSDLCAKQHWVNPTKPV